MRFESRDHAARLLLEQTRRFKGHNPLVLGIPRGGVPIAQVVGSGLGCPFDVLLVRKLRASGQADLSAGAVDEAGHVYRYGARSALHPEIDAGEIAEQVAEIRRLRRIYSRDLPVLSPAGHTALIVDDGISTAATMVAAIRSVRAQRPLRVVVAVPVASRGGVDLARCYADEVVCLYCPRVFYALDDFYDDFAMITDSEVVTRLEARRV